MRFPKALHQTHFRSRARLDETSPYAGRFFFYLLNLDVPTESVSTMRGFMQLLNELQVMRDFTMRLQKYNQIFRYAQSWNISGTPPKHCLSWFLLYPNPKALHVQPYPVMPWTSKKAEPISGHSWLLGTKKPFFCVWAVRTWAQEGWKDSFLIQSSSHPSFC